MTRWNTLELSQDNRHVVTLTLNRPAQRNAINRQLADELVECLGELRQRKDLRVLVLSGAGSVFCSGGDLKERLEAGPEHARLQRESALRAIELLEQLPCAVLAMINGPAPLRSARIPLAILENRPRRGCRTWCTRVSRRVGGHHLDRVGAGCHLVHAPTR